MRPYMCAACVCCLCVYVCMSCVSYFLLFDQIWFDAHTIHTHTHIHTHTQASSRIDLGRQRFLEKYASGCAFNSNLFDKILSKIMKFNKLHSFNICVCITRIYDIYAVMVINYVRRIAFDTEQKQTTKPLPAHHHQSSITITISTNQQGMECFELLSKAIPIFAIIINKIPMPRLQHILCI